MQEQEAQVIDPFTVKVIRIPYEMSEDELREIMEKFGPVNRVKIPVDQETGLSRGIGFATFRTSEDCTKVIDEGSIRYEYQEVQVARATMSK